MPPSASSFVLNTHFEWIGQALGFFSTAIQVQLLCSVLTGIHCGLPSFGMPRLHSCLVRQRTTKVDIAYAIVFINSSIALLLGVFLKASFGQVVRFDTRLMIAWLVG
jgi:hypothetical protein